MITKRCEAQMVPNATVCAIKLTSPCVSPSILSLSQQLTFSKIFFKYLTFMQYSQFTFVLNLTSFSFSLPIFFFQFYAKPLGVQLARSPMLSFLCCLQEFLWHKSMKLLVEHWHRTVFIKIITHTIMDQNVIEKSWVVSP